MAEMSKIEAQYLADMIAHHEKAVAMSEKLLASTSPSTRLAKVADLARAIIKAQTGEIAMMKKWLKDAGWAVPKPGSGDDMGSM